MSGRTSTDDGEATDGAGAPADEPGEGELNEGAFFRAVAESVSDPLLVLDEDRRVVFANRACRDLFAPERAAVTGAPFDALVDAPSVSPAASGTYEAEALVGDGVPVRLSSRTVETGGRRLTTVTVRERETSAARGDLSATRERLRRLLDAAPDAIVAADAKTGEVVDVNRAATELFGCDREVLLGRHQTDLHPPEEAERYRSIFDDHAAAGGILLDDEIREVVRADGERVPVEINAGVADLPDGTVVQGIFRDVSERTRRERELAANRDELERLNRVNRVIREIVQTLVDAESREEVERTVCERLVAAEPYVFAWVGGLEPGRSVLTASACADEDDPLVETGATTVDVDGDADCPTRLALENRSVRVVEDLAESADAEPWLADAVARGFRSCAAVPISHDGRQFGALTLYADEGGVFDTRERAVLSDLGAAIGHALNALERKAALISDTVVEVEVRTSDSLPALVEEVGEDGRITFERTIPVGEGYLQYVLVENISTDRFEDVVDGYPWCDRVRCVREGDPAVYEMRSTRLSMTSRFAAFGGRVRTAVVEEGALRVVAELPRSADVRRLLDALRRDRPDVELVSQRSVQRDDHPDRARVSLEETLTDRQQATLEAAYHAGYFEWPRDSTAEDVADSLGVSSPTVHKHLRHAHRQILEALLERPDLSGDGG